MSMMLRMTFLSVLLALLAFPMHGKAAGTWKSRFDEGLSAYTEGRTESAREIWVSALKEGRAEGGIHEREQTLDWLATLEESSGNLAHAEAYLRERVKVLSEATGPARLNYLTARAALARLLTRAGKLDQGQAILEENIGLYKEVGSGFVLAEPYLDLARHYEARGMFEASASQYRRALSALGDEVSSMRVQALQEYAEVLTQLDRADEAAGLRAQAAHVAEAVKQEVERNRERFLR